LVSLLLRGLLELLLVLVLLTDMVLRALIEEVLAAGARQLATSSVLANGVRDIGLRICDV
jgi:hypothetical protein